MQKGKWCANSHRTEHKRYLQLRSWHKKSRRGQTIDTLENNDIFLKTNDSKITLEIPPYALQQSHVGGLISIEHKLKFKVKTPYWSTSPKYYNLSIPSCSSHQRVPSDLSLLGTSLCSTWAGLSAPCRYRRGLAILLRKPLHFLSRFLLQYKIT